MLTKQNSKAGCCYIGRVSIDWLHFICSFCFAQKLLKTTLSPYMRAKNYLVDAG
jgi:hypothetical protein